MSGGIGREGEAGLTSAVKPPGHSERKKRLIALCGLTMLMSAFVVMFSVFLVAYMSPSKTAIIHVNIFNEAPIELALLLSTSVLGIYAFVLLFKDIRKI